MSSITSSHSCCGLDEISSIQRKPQLVLDDVCNAYALLDADEDDVYEKMPIAFLLFTDTTYRDEYDDEYQGGIELAEYIREHKLGGITASPIVNNPNTGNDIQVWVWEVYHMNLVEWYAKRVKEKEEKAKAQTPTP